MSAILIDLDGVVYVGSKPVPGAREAIAWLEASQTPHLFLTNTTSRPRSRVAEKLGEMGIEVRENEILTPPVAAVDWLKEHVDGSIALFLPEATAVDFASIPIAQEGEPVAAVVLGDYGEKWSFDELNRAFRLLMGEPPPRLIALGMTRYWRAPDGLRLDTGAFVAGLSRASGIEPIVVGKPAKEFFAAAISILDSTLETTVMVGDDIEADIHGAQSAGLRGVLVRTGKFRPADLKSPIEPDAILASIADLPRWWGSQQELA